MSDSLLNEGKTTVDKADRYKWTPLDNRGHFDWVDKTKLEVDHTYQRPEAKQKVLRIAAEFSWQKFGCLVVSLRADGRHVVIDGQHRAMAVLRRDDITQVPCMIFTELEVSDKYTMQRMVGCGCGWLVDFRRELR